MGKGSETKKGIEVVKGVYAALASGDAAGALGAFDPNIEWREAEGFLYADGNPYVGAQAVAEGVLQRFGGSVENLAVVPRGFIDGGDSVVVEGRYSGTFKATGRPVDAQFAHVWQVRDGKVVRFQQYTDTKQWADAAGD
jgi:ketosteroid isomerase-like protein